MKDMKQLFSIPDDEEVRLWNQFAKGTYELITAKPSTTLQDSSISSGQVFGYVFFSYIYKVVLQLPSRRLLFQSQLWKHQKNV